MENTQVRVLTTETKVRLGLQNSVVRKLRGLGCTIKAATLDTALTISVEPSEAFRRLPKVGGLLKQRTPSGCLVSIDIDGCRVIWLEGGIA